MDSGEPAPPRKRRRIVMLGILLGVIAVEAVGVFIFVKTFLGKSGPAQAEASVAPAPASGGEHGAPAGGHGAAAAPAGGHGAPAAGGQGAAAPSGGEGGLNAKEGTPAPASVEVKVGEFRAQNRRGQQSYILQFTVYASVADSDKPRLEETITAKSAKLKDRFIRVVRGMEPERFVEPDLTTLRTQIKEELCNVVGGGMKVEEVLLAEFTCTTEN
jgi:flagellar basal body-associated protein FliL